VKRYMWAGPGDRDTCRKSGINRDTRVLDVCCALGGPARHLAGKYGCRVIGLDATMKMVDEAVSGQIGGAFTSYRFQARERP